MRKTTFAGLTVLDENDSLYTDGASFLTVNPVLTDRLLEVGAITHRHDAHLALPNPTASASAGVSPTGGAIAPDLPIYIAFSLVDDEGGETVLAPATSVTTQAAYDAPSSEITASANYDSGTLVADTYYYAITLLDAGGGQTTLGPTVTVERAPGYANGRVLLSGLDNDFTVDGAVAWRLYRAIGGSDWSYIAQGSTDSFIDDGLDCADTSVSPPLADTQNSTNHTNLLRVVLPTAEPSLASAAAMRLYLSTDGDFQSPSFYQQFPTASAGQIISVPALAVTEGAPPDVSTCFPGASQIDPDTDILDWHWKRPVSAHADLPVGTRGDVRLVTDTGALYGVLQASAVTYLDWDLVGGVGGGGGSGVTVAGSAGAGSLGDQLEIRFVGSGGVEVVVQSIDADTAQVLIGGTGGGGGSELAEVFAEAVGINVAIPDSGSAVDTPNLTVTGEGVLGEDYAIEIELYLTHTYLGDLTVSLVAPDSTSVELVDGYVVLLGQSNFGTAWVDGQKLVITGDAVDPLRENAAGVGADGTPIVGRFLPGPYPATPAGVAGGLELTALDGLPIAGDWKLRVQDQSAGDTGTIVSWGLRFVPLVDDGHDKVLVDSNELQFRASGAVGVTRSRLYGRPGRKLATVNIAGSEDFEFLQGAGTWDGTNERPSASAGTKQMRWGNNVLYGTQHARWMDAFEMTFPIAFPSGAVSSVGTTKFGLMDEDGNFVYAKVDSSGSNLRATVECRFADGTVRTILSPVSTAATNLTVGGTVRYAYIVLRRYRGLYAIQIWKEEPSGTYEAVPLVSTSALLNDTDNNGLDVRLKRLFAFGEREADLTVEVVATATTAPILFNGVYGASGGFKVKGYQADLFGSHEIVAQTGRWDDYDGSGFRGAGFNVVAGNRHLSWEHADLFNGSFGDFVYFVREESGIVHVNGKGVTTASEDRINGLPIPQEHWPAHDIYVTAVYSDGSGAELLKIQAADGNIVRLTTTAAKTIGFNVSYPAALLLP